MYHRVVEAIPRTTYGVELLPFVVMAQLLDSRLIKLDEQHSRPISAAGLCNKILTSPNVDSVAVFSTDSNLCWLKGPIR